MKKQDKEKGSFYITTTLPYINSKPHVGFAREIIRADVMARYNRILDKEIFFNTGTDEHGLKVLRKSEELGMDIQEYCNKQAENFRDLKEILNLSFNNFIRTTDEKHIKAVQEFWRKCLKNGYIYKKNYKIKYCVGCELEKTDSELDENGFCPLHPNQSLEIIEEENYFFKFSAFGKKLLEFYEKNPGFTVPDKRFNEIKSFVKMGLEDFSISRLKEKMPWGVPVPDDETQVMYVWFDALVNYISAIGWPNDQLSFEKWWPVVQICGKDNLRQQSAMWQAMLMAAGIENSRKVYVEGFITSEGQKMSKSLGNVIAPKEMVEKFGTDATRYLLLSLGIFGEDLDLTWERMSEKYNADLANGLGNLVSRIVKLSEKAETPENLLNPPLENGEVRKLDWGKYDKVFDEGKIEQVLGEIWEIIKKADKFVEENKPWELAKTDKNKFNEVMEKLLIDLGVIAGMLKPFMPETSKKIKKIIKTRKPEVLFPRI